ncbi:MAG: ATP-binding protein [Planctomycetaceae bacterium]|nr:ATP-binding protein [Planctomycetaceae bacterium]
MTATYEQLGSFYLGRRHDLATGETAADLLYDSKDLCTHAVCVGMTGSGKTGLCLSLLEEAGLDGIPAIAIDPKGDLGNLLLTFPELRPDDFRPWIDESVAARKGLSPDDFAAQTAELWRNGLGKWGQSGERIGRYNAAVDKVIYTPGSTAGVPLTILKSFNAPPSAVMNDGDAYRDRVQSAASGVLALLGIDADPVKSREHILLSNVLDHAWRDGRDLDLAALIHEIQTPPFKRVGVVDLDTFFPAADRLELGMRLNNLLASPSFSSWMEGEPLDVQRLLYTPEGRPRLSILSIAHLSDSERMFFVTILLNEVLAWMRTQPGTGSLRALLYMDEVFGYFPPLGNPPTKRPMLTLLKQARAFGLGCVLATQNPVDLDYKGLSNAGTWFLGRLQTERDKARVIEGLEGASAEAGAKFDRGKMEATLAALGNRVFLMNNVHDNAPSVFQTRWAMSYLAGPLTRAHIARLMHDRKAQAAAAAAASGAAATDSDSATPATTSGLRDSVAGARPVLSADVPQRFWPVSEPPPPGAKLAYRPALVGAGRLHFVKASDDVDAWREFVALQPIHGELPRPLWHSAMVFDTAPSLAENPHGEAAYADIPGEAAEPKSYKSWAGDLEDRLYQTERYVAWECAQLDARSDAGESEGDFRVRMSQLARERRDEQKDRVRAKFAKDTERAEANLAKAEKKLAEVKSRFWSRVWEMILRVVEVVAIKAFGGRTRKQIYTSSSGRQTMEARSRAARAEAEVEEAREKLLEVKADCERDIQQLQLDFEPANLKLNRVEVSPRKSDIAVDEVVLAWLPWWVGGEAGDRPAY